MRRTRRERDDLEAIARAIADGDEAQGGARPRRPLPGLCILALAAWAGAAIGMTVPALDLGATPIAPALVGLAAAAAVGWRFATRRRRRLEAVPILYAALAVALLSCGWAIDRSAADRRAVAALGEASDGGRSLVRLRCIVASTARATPRGDRLHAFFRQPSDALLEVDAISIGPIDRDRSTLLHGRVQLRLREGAAPWQVGDRLDAIGMFLPERPAANPGGRPAALATLAPRRLGRLDVPDPRLVVATAREDLSLAGTFRRIRADWQARTLALLDRMLDAAPDPPPPRRDLLRALLLGERRSAGYAALREDFAISGLAHFLAISGFNLAVIAGAAAVAARIAGLRPRRRGLVVIAAIAAYVLALPAQLPVLRAGLSATLLAAGSALARRWDGRAVTALAAIVLLAIAPGEAVQAGFQLSFAAVFALQELAPRLRRRWFGDPDHLGRSTRSILASRAADAVAACVAAWAISTPIALHHFGMAALLGVPATLLATPIVAATVSFAAIALPIAALAPGTAPISGLLLSELAAAILAIAEGFASVPQAAFRGASPGAAATLLLLALAGAWLAATRRTASLAAAAMLGALLAIALPSPARANEIEAVFLAVGDGTAILLRRGDRGVLVDAGSVGDRAVGGRTVDRAAAALGIARLEAVFTSHPNLDHYSGLAEVLARHREARWFVGEAFIGAARRRPDGPEAAALALAAALGRVPGVLAAGDAVEAAGLRLRCLHPEPGASFASANDASLVLRADPREVPSAARPILASTGDLEAAGLRAAAAALAPIDPILAEVPHHGSVVAEAIELLAAKPSTIWVQSTGPRRLRPDSLSSALAARRESPPVRRLVTARDGAVSAIFAIEDAAAALRSVRRFEGGWIAIDLRAR